MNKNLTLRLIVALFGIPALIFICYYGGYYLFGFAVLLVGLGGAELALMLRQRGYRISLFLSILLPIFFILAAYFNYPLLDAVVFALFLQTVIVVVNYSRAKSPDLSNFLGDMYAHILPASYLGLLASYIIFVGKIDEIGGRLLIFAFLLTWAADTGAYFGGKNLGKHKLSIPLSPNKTWEGAYFGLAAALLAAVFSKLVFLPISWPEVILMALLAGILGQFGDLFESAIKRHCNVKDSSAILPGHGGILDRFDSFLFAVPVIYYVNVFWN